MARLRFLAAVITGMAACWPLLSGCGGAESSREDVSKPAAQTPKLKVESPAFADGQSIPGKYTEDGEDVSPPLKWSGVPEGAKELALIVDDPDAPSKQPWVHWVIYALPGGTLELPEGCSCVKSGRHPEVGLEGSNSWGVAGYRGPAPPPGLHHYHFKLHALDAPLNLQKGLDKPALLKAMQGHVIAQGELVGTYRR